MTQGLASVFADCPKVSAQHVPLSQEGEVTFGPHASSDSGEPSEGLTKQWAPAGIMVFSPSCRVLYANQSAYHFLTLLNYRETGHATSGALPASVADLFDQILRSLASPITIGAGKQIEARRVLVGRDHAVVLYAFGLPDRLEIGGLRVVITMRDGIDPINDICSNAFTRI